MEPSNHFILSYQLLSRTITRVELENYYQYLTDLARMTFVTLQSDRELMTTFTAYLLMIHHLISQIEHLQKSLDSLSTLEFENPLANVENQYDMTSCGCLYCKFPCLCNAPMETRQANLLNYLSSIECHTRKFILAVLEKILEVQKIHKATMKYLYPRMSPEDISRYVTLNE